MSVGEATVSQHTAKVEESASPLYRLSVNQVRRMCEEGILDSDQSVELLEGILVDRDRGQESGMSSSEVHRFLVQKIRELFRSLIDRNLAHVVSEADACLSESSLLLPDVSIVRGQLASFENRYPEAGDLLLCLEVAKTSLQRDRGIKAGVYASARLGTYLIVNLVGDVVELYTDPDPSSGEYLTRKTYGRGTALTIDLGDLGMITFDAADCLPTVAP